MSTYSAGSASVQIVPDFSNAQRKIGEWFARQNDLKVTVEPDLSNVGMARMRAEIAAQHPEVKVGIDKKHLASQMVTAVDFLTGTSMVGNALKKLFDVKPILMTNLAGAGVALGSVIGQSLTTAVGGAAAMLPSLVSAAAIPIGTAILGSQGIGDAFKALGGTTQADAKKLAAAMKDLAPAAREFVTEVHSLAPAFKDLRLDVQQHLFAGLGDTIRSLGEKMLPMLRGHLTGIADEINGMGKALAGALGSDSNVADFAHTIDNVKAALHGITGAIAPLWSVFQNLATVGSDFLPGLTKGFGDLATKFATFIQQARDSGALKDFIQNAFDGFKKVWGVVTDLGGILKTVFTAALPSGQVLMSVLKLVTGDLDAFFKTDAAKSGLTTFFEGLTDAIGSLTPGLTSLVSALVTSVLPAMAGLAQAVAPIVNDLGVQFADLLTTLGPLFYPALAGAISTALGALSPLVTVFADLATTVLPVVIEAIQNLAPLFAELAEGVGAALVRAISALAPALPPIVEAFQAIAEALVPFSLSVLNIAVDILPPFVAILQGLAKVVTFLSPILPALVTSFLAFKAVGILVAIFGAVSAALDGFALKAVYGMARAARAVTVTNVAVGALVIGIGIVTSAISHANAEIDQWAKGLLAGGAAARAVIKETGDNSLWDKISFNLKRTFSADAFSAKPFSYQAEQMKQAREEAHKLFEAMSPLEQSQSKVTYWTNELNDRMSRFGENSPQVEAAQRRLHYWSGELASQEQLQADATKTATERLKEQADQQRAMVDAGLALEQAILGIHSAMDDYNKVMADGTATDDDRSRASIGVRQAILDAADAAQKKAEADYTGNDAAEKSRLGSEAFIGMLKQQAALLTGPAADAMNAYIKDYENVHGAAATAQAGIKDLGLSIVSVPDSKSVMVSVPTADQVAKLRALGYEIQYLPNGMVKVITDTSQARADLQAFLNTIPKSVPVRIVGNTLLAVGGKGSGGSIAGAIGGIVHAYRDGGFEQMKGGIAQVVKPNTWRIIGDRVKDDEAYIPINRDARSKKILATTASRMGFGLVANADGNYIKYGSVSDAEWSRLLVSGWKGRAGDSMEALYPPAGWVPPGMNSVTKADVAATVARNDADTLRRAVLGGQHYIAGFVNNGTVVTTDLDELARKSRIGTQRALSVAGL